ncbi:MAG: 50S ribosomal protein L9 [Candidatus Staskawiczbacteria bacterium RIFOXYD1_FULL_39_28]|uniref:Large ribosomal subunit protein bL9 n=1 Tax=Candidatus Staskawiczbacteria bacterium RIFOXYC1_FULL_38_18 TaxID=1802229 RepID=A0A1G2JC14_9BACT|nr:MAG: 50S ribosomal protein L9 [Candidatus Staskawiczbacteria bacterium RIFOXYC1_FULL_38_18]OGZ91042.1 MAG: 50S ribosomal protein L9 [Candidatus Staskawiczbacteria bacterium RIFOXYD1_FULL_39_28]
MKVILLQDIENLGKKYEIKEVKDGYARNFLLPGKMARAATRQALKWLGDQKEVIEKEAVEDLAKVQALASAMDGLEVSISVKIGEEGQLFESINSQKIAEKLKEMGFEVKKSQILLENPIKETGEFPVKINLDHNLEVEIKAIIAGEGGTKEEKEEE